MAVSSCHRVSCRDRHVGRLRQQGRRLFGDVDPDRLSTSRTRRQRSRRPGSCRRPTLPARHGRIPRSPSRESRGHRHERRAERLAEGERISIPVGGRDRLIRDLSGVHGHVTDRCQNRERVAHPLRALSRVLGQRRPVWTERPRPERKRAGRRTRRRSEEETWPNWDGTAGRVPGESRAHEWSSCNRWLG